MRKAPFQAIVAVLIGISCPLAWAEEEEGELGREPGYPASEARRRIEGLIRDLGHPDAAIRDEAAQKLAGEGEAAEAPLREAAQSADPEVAARARGILERVGRFLTPEEEKSFADLKDRLGEARIPEQAREAFQELRALGKPGDGFLRGAFPQNPSQAQVPDGRLRIEIVEGLSKMRRGEPVVCRARLTNTGESPVWIRPHPMGRAKGPPDLELPPPQTLRIDVENARRATARLLVEAPPASPQGRGGAKLPGGPRIGGAQIAPGGLFEGSEGDPFDVIPLPPDGTFERDVFLPPTEADFVGTFDLTVRYQAEWGVNGLGIKILRKAAWGDPEKTREIREAKGPLRWPHTARAEAPTRRVHLLPEPTEADRKRAALALSLDPTDPDGRIPILLTLTAAEALTIAAPDGERPAEGFWIAVLDDKKEVVELIPFARTPEAVVRKTRALSPEEALRLEGTIPVALPPGDYTVIAGYSASAYPVTQGPVKKGGKASYLDRREIRPDAPLTGIDVVSEPVALRIPPSENIR